MAAYSLIVNNSVLIDIPTDFSNNGWSISGGKATHGGCNAGLITLTDANLLPLTSYVITYEVSAYASGLVKVITGGVDGDDRVADGIYTETVTTGSDGTLQFYSDGVVTLDYINYYLLAGSEVDNSITLAFNEKGDKFVTYHSYKPEMMIKFLDGFFISVDGQLWEQNTNAIRNNFCGTQYTSQITFYVNINPTTIKTLYSMRQKSNKVWSVTNVEVMAREGKPNGQRSRLKKGRFKRLQGDWFADFLKDQLDPRFDAELEALMNGADLQGSIFKITVQNDDIAEVRLLSMDFTTSPSNYTY